METKFARGADLVTPKEETYEPPTMSLRDYYVTHAPPPPAWWKCRVPDDLARWAWTYADALIKTRLEKTASHSAQTPGVNRP
jgi:hypothetical protein